MWYSEMYWDFKILEEMFMPRNWYWSWSQKAFYRVFNWDFQDTSLYM